MSVLVYSLYETRAILFVGFGSKAHCSLLHWVNQVKLVVGEHCLNYIEEHVLSGGTQGVFCETRPHILAEIRNHLKDKLSFYAFQVHF